jgi:hypothetical protein
MKLIFIISTVVLFALSLSACARQEQQNQQTSVDTLKTASSSDRASTGDSTGFPRHPSAPQLRVRESKSATADTVVGEVYVAGNEPFTRVMLSLASSRRIILEGDTATQNKLREMQGERIRVVGTMKKSIMGTAIVIKEFCRVKENRE